MRVAVMFLLFPVLVAGVISSAGCGRAPLEAQQSAVPLVVKVARVEARERERTQAVAGTLRPRDHALVAAKLMGTVVRAEFAVGQTVEAGQVLVELSADEVAARLAQAEAGLAATLREQTRETALRDQGVTPAETVRTLEDRRRAAEAAVSEARAMQTYLRVVAPFAGVITRKQVQAGDLATPGATLFALEGVGRLAAELEVPGVLPVHAPGTRLAIRAGGVELAGELTEISPAVDAVTRTRFAKVALREGQAGVGSGDFVRVEWPAGRETVRVVPGEAVASLGQMERVFVVEGGRARLRLVKSAGRDEAGRVRINSGLDVGEAVVLNAPVALRDGQVVEVQP